MVPASAAREAKASRLASGEPNHQFPALFAVLPSDADVTRSRIFATPASAQASSLSPPGGVAVKRGDEIVAALDGDAEIGRAHV